MKTNCCVCGSEFEAKNFFHTMCMDCLIDFGDLEAESHE